MSSSAAVKTNISPRLNAMPNPDTTQAKATGAPQGATGVPTPFDGDASLVEPGLSASPATSSTVGLENETVGMLTTFSSGLATWMDIFDFNLSYQRNVCRRALQSRLLLHCICAFVAKHLSLLPAGDVWQPIVSRYYGEVRSSCALPPNVASPLPTVE